MNESHVSIAKRALGVLVVLGVIAFIVYGLYLANKPVVAPLQGQIDGRYIDISPKIVGRIATLHVREGDEVKPGALLVRLDSPEVQAKVSQSCAGAPRRSSSFWTSVCDREEVRTARANWERSVPWPTPGSEFQAYQRAAAGRIGFAAAQRRGRNGLPVALDAVRRARNMISRQWFRASNARRSEVTQVQLQEGSLAADICSSRRSQPRSTRSCCIKASLRRPDFPS
jgi:multidrug efflux pump subunit AcrA (membrane-fusion protein)